MEPKEAWQGQEVRPTERCVHYQRACVLFFWGDRQIHIVTQSMSIDEASSLSQILTGTSHLEGDKSSSGLPPGSLQTHDIASKKTRVIYCGFPCTGLDTLGCICSLFLTAYGPLSLPGGEGDYD